jgi:hypothetical protein
MGDSFEFEAAFCDHEAARLKGLLIDPRKDDFRRCGRLGELLFVYDQPRIARLEFVAPSRALALRFLRHVSEPLHRLILVDVVYSGAAQAYELLKVSSKT